MARWEGRVLLFEHHETAWSLRTTGFPIWAARVEGERVVLRKVAETSKKAFAVKLPEGFQAIIRYYESNHGYPSLYVYFPNGNTVYVHRANAQELTDDSNPIIRTAAWGVQYDRWPEWVEKEG